MSAGRSGVAGGEWTGYDGGSGWITAGGQRNKVTTPGRPDTVNV